MGRPRASPTATKTKISLTLDSGLLSWLEARTGAGKQFSTVSHAVERGIVALQKTEEIEEQTAQALMERIVQMHKRGDSAGVAGAASELHKRRKGTSARSRTATSEK